MNARILAYILCLTILLNACAPTIVPALSPTETVPSPATETHPPTTTASPVPPTATHTAEPTATATPLPKLGIAAAAIQPFYEDLGMEFSSTQADGKPALKGTDPFLPEVRVLLIGDQANLDSVQLVIAIYDTEALYLSLLTYAEPVFLARGSSPAYLDFLETLNDRTVDAINTGMSAGELVSENFLVSYEISEDEITYTFAPKL